MCKIKKVITDTFLKTKQCLMECRIIDLMLFSIITIIAIASILSSSYLMIILIATITIAFGCMSSKDNRKVEVDEDEIWYVKDIGLLWEFIKCYLKVKRIQFSKKSHFKPIKNLIAKVEIRVVLTILLLLIASLLLKNIYIIGVSLVIVVLTLYISKHITMLKEEDEIWRISDLGLIASFLFAIVRLVYKKITSITFKRSISIKTNMTSFKERLKSVITKIQKMNRLDLMRRVSICSLAFTLFAMQINITSANENQISNPQTMNTQQVDSANENGDINNSDNAVVKEVSAFKDFKEDGLSAYLSIEKDRGTIESELGLPSTITVVLSDGSEESISVTWRCIDDSFGNDVYDSENSNAIYTFEAVLPTDYKLVSDMVVLPWLNVVLNEQVDEMQQENDIIKPIAKIETSATVSDFSQLQSAIADSNISEIIINTSFSITSEIIVTHNVLIKGTNDTICLSRGTSDVMFHVFGKGVTLSIGSLILDGNKENYTESKPIITVNDSGNLNINTGTLIQNNMGSSDSSAINQRETYQNAIDANKGTAVLVFDGNVIMNDGIIRNNVKYNYVNESDMADGGTAFLIFEDGTLTINNGEISGNVVNSSGGAIASYGTVIMNNGIIKNNTVLKGIFGGAGIRLYAYQNNDTKDVIAGKFYMSGGVFSNNKIATSKGRGGAIYNTSACETYISGGLIDSTNVAEEGSAIYHSAASNEPSSNIPLAKLMVSGDAIINSSIYLYEGVYLTALSAIQKSIALQPMNYKADSSLIKGEGYTLTESDVRKIKIEKKDSTSWFTSLNEESNTIVLSKTSGLLKNEIYVDGVNGNDSTGTGTLEKPLKSLEAGLEYVAPGGTIYIDDTITIDKQVVIEAPENIYGSEGVTIKPSKTCGESTKVCTGGVIVVSPDGELILGPIKVETPITVEEGGKLSISEQTKLRASIKKHPQDMVVAKDASNQKLAVEVNEVENYTLTYQWYVNTKNTNVDGKEISGATASEFSVPTDEVGSKYYYCKITATNTAITDTYALTSDVARIKVVSKPAITSTNETIDGWNDGIIKDVDDTMEYKKSTDSEYKVVETEKTEITGLAPGTYDVRYQGTNDSLKTQITIEKGSAFSYAASVKDIVFDDVNYGDTAPIMDIEVTNNSNAYITIKEVQVSGTDFTIINNENISEKIEKNETNKKYQVRANLGSTKDKYTATITIKLDGNGTEYTITKNVNLTVNNKEISVSAKEGTIISKVYDGYDKATVKLEDCVLSGIQSGDDVSIQFDEEQTIYNSPNVNEANKVTASNIKLIGNDANKYTLKSDSVEFNGVITKKEITLEWKEQTYYQWTGKPQYITPITFLDVYGTQQDMPYKVTKDGKKADFKDGGVYVFEFVASEWTEESFGEVPNNYTISNSSQLSKEYTIESHVLSKEMVSGINSSYMHTGGPIRPVPTIIMNGNTLDKKTDYTVSYDAEYYTAPGKYSVTITGKGKYVGTLKFDYQVECAKFEGDPLANVERGEGGYFSENIRLEPKTLKNGYYGSLNPSSSDSTYTLSEEGTNITIRLYFYEGNGKPIYYKDVVYSMDKTDPEITGISDYKIYYVNQKAIIQDANPYQFILNKVNVGDESAVKIKGDEYTVEVEAIEKELKLRAIDKAGNSTNYYNLTLKPLTSILDSKITLTAVKASDGKAIEKAISTYQGIDTTYATQEQKSKLQELLSYAQSLQAKLNTIQNTLKEINDATKLEITQIKSSQREDLVGLKEKAETLLKEDNLSESEKEELKGQLAIIDDLITRIDVVSDVVKQKEDALSNLAVNKVTSDDADELKDLKKDLNAMLSDEYQYKDNFTEEERNKLQDLVDKISSCLDRIDEVKSKVDEIAEQLNSLNKDDIKSDDKTVLQNIKNTADVLLNGNNLSESEKNNVNNIVDKVNELLVKIEEIKQQIEDIRECNEKSITEVTSDDTKDLNNTKDKIGELLNSNNLNTDEKQELTKIENDIVQKLEQIKKVQDELDKLDAVKDKNKDNVIKEDQDVLDDVKKVIDELEGEYKNNTTQNEKKTTENIKNNVDEMQKTLDEVTSLEDAFKDIPLKKDYNEQEKETINDLLDRIDNLSEHQKNIFDEHTMEKIVQIRVIVRKKIVAEKDHGIIVEGVNDTDFALETILSVTLVTDKVDKSSITLVNNQEIKDVYDIKLLLNGSVIQPNGKVKISIPLTEEQKKYEHIKIYYLGNDGKNVEIPYVRVKDNVIFETDHFSYYAIVADKVDHIVDYKDTGVDSKDYTQKEIYLVMMLAATLVLSRKKIKQS